MTRLAKRLMASVISASVFRRFAQLSKDDKAKVVKKVKEKVNGKGKKKTKDKKPNGKGKKPQKGKVPPQFQKGKKDEDVVEDDVLDQKTEVPEEAAGDEGEPPKEEPSQDLESIVDELASEIEGIKSDGKVTPQEAMGLMGEMMRMVQLLLNAKPGRARKSSVGREIAAEFREDAIATRVAGSVEQK